MTIKLTHNRLVQLLDYDPSNGFFTQRTTGKKVGMGCSSTNKYGRIMLDGIRYYSHKLAWFWVHEVYPEGMTDHINNDRTDNRIANLRPCTRGQNCRNAVLRKDSSSKHKDVAKYIRRDGSVCWRVRIQVDSKRISYGLYDDIELADLVAREAREKLHGEFYKHG